MVKPYKTHLLFCTGGDCKKKNKKNYKKAKKMLKKNNQHFVRCSKTKCLGACKHSPVVMLYPHGTWYGNVKKKKHIKRIIKRHVINGEPYEKKQILQMPRPE
jgi:(2Fe-2S) ferredoxin